MPSKDFKAWVKDTCGISESTAYNYIRIHKNYDAIKEKGSYVDALKAMRVKGLPKSEPTNVPQTDWQKEVIAFADECAVKGTLDKRYLPQKVWRQ